MFELERKKLSHQVDFSKLVLIIGSLKLLLPGAELIHMHMSNSSFICSNKKLEVTTQNSVSTVGHRGTEMF